MYVVIGEQHSQNSSKIYYLIAEIWKYFWKRLHTIQMTTKNSPLSVS